MATIPDVFHYRTLTEAIKQIKPVPRLLFDLLLKSPRSNPPKYAATKSIEFDIKRVGPILPRFVKRSSQAPARNLKNYTHVVLEPPTVKFYDDITYDEIWTMRDAGEPLTQVQMDHLTNWIADTQREQKESVIAAWEWMLAQILLTGKVTYSGTDTKFEYDFQMDSSFMSESADWSDTTLKAPLTDLREWRVAMSKETGIMPTLAFVTPDVAKVLIENTALERLLDNRRIDVGTLVYDFPFIGNIQGLNIYEFNETIVNDVGSEVNLHGASNLCILTTPEMFKPFYAAAFSENGPVLTDLYAYSENIVNPGGKRVYAESHGMPVILHDKGVIKATITVS